MHDDGLEQDRKWARWALEQWSTFPAKTDSRPLVLVGPTTQPERGFCSGSAKLAFLSGDVDGDASVPPAVLNLLRDTHWNGAAPFKEDRLIVYNARLSEHEFLTDRGRRTLPAWELESEGAVGSIWVLDPELVRKAWTPIEPPHRQPPFPRTPHRARDASGVLDQTTITFRFIGAPEAIADYRFGEAIETSSALVILPRITYREPFAHPSHVSAAGQIRSVTVKLHEPIGTRVLIDLDASPVMVTPERPAPNDLPMLRVLQDHDA